MRYPVSGANATAILSSTASSAQQVKSITTGRVFWLRGVAVAFIAATGGQLELADATVGSTATSSVLIVPLQLQTATVYNIVPAVLNLGAPGLKFATNVVARTVNATNIPIGNVSVWGFEE